MLTGLLIIFSIFSVAVLIILALFFIRQYAQNYQQCLHKITNKNGVDSLESATIGGISQWLHIRGRNQDNPVLLFLHGGPGFSHIGWFDDIQRPWENYFTVVQWDQRQSGKSYLSLKKIGHTVSHQRLIDDAEEVVSYLRKRFGQEKIFLVGTSYGTYLGMHLVKRRPDWLHAYIGVGQVVAMVEHAQVEHHLLMDQAKAAGDQEGLESLGKMLPFPDPNDRAGSFFKHCATLLDRASALGKCYPANLKSIMAMVWVNQILSPHYSWRDLWNKAFGDPMVVTCLDYPFAESFMQYDLPAEIGSEFDVPVFFFTGVDDWHVASALSERWFNEIKAPL